MSTIDSSDYGRYAMALHYGCDLSWEQASTLLTALRDIETSPDAARVAANRYRVKNPGAERAATCPAELIGLVQKLRTDEPLNVEEAECKEADKRESASFVVDGNEAELAYQGPIKTLEGLIASHKINPDVWVVAGKVTHNTWTTPAFDRDSETWSYFQNHQVKAPFAKRHPEPIYPQVQPIQPAATFSKPEPSYTDGQVITQLLFGDTHVGFRKDPYSAQLTPFHDRRALDLLVQLVAYIQPDVVALLGDGIDAAELSDKFPREPDMLGTLEPALVELHWLWSQVRQCAPKDTRCIYIEGNHEGRLRRWLIAHFPAVYNLKRADALDLPPVLSFENLIALDALQVEWVPGYPDNNVWLEGLWGQHGDVARKNPGSTGWAILQDADENEAYAHIHREELVTKSINRRRGRQVVRALCPGCLCHVDGRVPGSSADDYWSQGVVVRQTVAGKGISSDTFVHFDQGQCVYDGKWFTHRDRTDDLGCAFPDYSW